MSQAHSEAEEGFQGGDLPLKVGPGIKKAEEVLACAGAASPRLEAQILASHSLGKERSWALAHPDAPLPSSFWAFVARRSAHEPLAYVTGRREFFGRTFLVNPSVLIPRHETEVVVEACLNLSGVSRALDIGAGSGCIGITLALERPGWSVEAVEVSPGAWTVTKANAQLLGAPLVVHLADLLPPGSQQWDLIVSNPPYIGRDEPLPREVAGFEPSQALFAEDTGMALYARLARELPSRLSAGGKLVLEAGDGRAEDVARLFSAEGWTFLGARKDLDGWDRALLFSPGESPLATAPCHNR